MKKILALVAFLLVIFLVSFPFLIRHQVQGSLEKFFQDAKVQIGSLGIEKGAVTLSSIEITHQDYDIRIPKIAVDSKIKVTLLAPRVSLKKMPSWLPSQSQSEPSQPQTSETKTPSLPANISTVEISDGTIELNLKKITGTANITVDYDVAQKRVRNLTLSIPSAKSDQFSIKKLNLSLPNGSRGEVSVEKASYNKYDLLTIRGPITSSDGKYTANLTASLLDSHLQAAINVFRSPSSNQWTYELDIDTQEVVLEKWTQKLEMQNKVSLSGKLLGKISLSGDLSGIRSLNGTLQADSAGGDLIIQDRTMLAKLAANMRQPVELVEAGFKEYHFDTGKLSIGMSGRDLDLTVNLEGEKGKRDFTIKWHDALQNGG